MADWQETTECDLCGGEGVHDGGCQRVVVQHFTAEALIRALEGSAASTIDAYIGLREREGLDHDAAKDQAVAEVVEGAMDWLGVASYEPPPDQVVEFIDAHLRDRILAADEAVVSGSATTSAPKGLGSVHLGPAPSDTSEPAVQP